jgi:hypothetical protein
MKQEKGYVKVAGHSSNDECILSFTTEGDEREMYVVLDVSKCSKIVGLKDYLSMYIGNQLRVFTPAIITFHNNNRVEVNLTLEKVSWNCKYEKELPNWMREKRENSIVLG